MCSLKKQSKISAELSWPPAASMATSVEPLMVNPSSRIPVAFPSKAICTEPPEISQFELRRPKSPQRNVTLARLRRIGGAVSFSSNPVLGHNVRTSNSSSAAAATTESQSEKHSSSAGSAAHASRLVQTVPLHSVRFPPKQLSLSSLDAKTPVQLISPIVVFTSQAFSSSVSTSSAPKPRKINPLFTKLSSNRTSFVSRVVKGPFSTMLLLPSLFWKTIRVKLMAAAALEMIELLAAFCRKTASSMETRELVTFSSKRERPSVELTEEDIDTVATPSLLSQRHDSKDTTLSTMGSTRISIEVTLASSNEMPLKTTGPSGCNTRKWLDPPTNEQWGSPFPYDSHSIVVPLEERTSMAESDPFNSRVVFAQMVKTPPSDVTDVERASQLLKHSTTFGEHDARFEQSALQSVMFPSIQPSFFSLESSIPVQSISPVVVLSAQMLSFP
mmetsp:Transcript_7249/g.10630  ORF Transcript_7249/g.10630 Transcript_7249/m.10630 type:complete len:444 (-) Transcript_7249:607-1938(-)